MSREPQGIRADGCQNAEGVLQGIVPHSGTLVLADLAARRRDRPRYSIRTFAKDLGISHTFLSRYLRGERRISSGAAFSISEALGWQGDQKRQFLLLVEVELAEDEVRRTALILEYRSLCAGPQSYAQLLQSQFLVLTRWYYVPLMELVSVISGPHDPKVIAARLALTPMECSLAIERLCAVGLLRWDGDRLVRQNDKQATGDIPSQTIRAFHKMMLERAVAAIDVQPPDKRDFLALTVPANASRLPELRDKIRRFVTQLCEEFAPDPTSLDSVYQINFQAFRLDRDWEQQSDSTSTNTLH